MPLVYPSDRKRDKLPRLPTPTPTAADISAGGGDGHGVTSYFHYRNPSHPMTSVLPRVAAVFKPTRAVETFQSKFNALRLAEERLM